MPEIPTVDQIIAHLLVEADFDRSWTDGRRGSYISQEYYALRIAHAEKLEKWANEIKRISDLWQPMNTAPRDGTAVLVLLAQSDIPHAARWLSGPDDQHATGFTMGQGWHLTWDGWPVPFHDGPRYWMPCPDDPDRTA